jgi:hypothetical protein
MSEPNPNQTLSLELQLVTIEEEDDDLDTLGADRKVGRTVQQELTALEGYTISSPPPPPEGEENATRSPDFLLLIAQAAQNAIENKELLLGLFSSATAAINLLGKQGRIKKVELVLGDGKTLTLEDTDKATAQSLMEQVEAKHPGTLAQLKSGSTKMRVKGKVSKQSKK